MFLAAEKGWEEGWWRRSGRSSSGDGRSAGSRHHRRSRMDVAARWWSNSSVLHWKLCALATNIESRVANAAAFRTPSSRLP